MPERDLGSEQVLMIEIANVSYTYPASPRPTLSAFELRVAKGSIAILLAESGSGKSTVVKLLTAAIQPDAGSITVNGSRVDSLDAKERARYRRTIGMVTTDAPLIRDRTVAENILLPLEFAGFRHSRAHAQLALVLERFGMAEKKDQLPDQLAMSERELALIARAVAAEPRLLVLDEPTAHLDLEGMRRVLDMIARENLRGMTVLIATHDERVASLLPDARIVDMDAHL